MACKTIALPTELDAHKSGASEEDRTLYLDVGNVTLYQMSYTRIITIFKSGIKGGSELVAQ
tara:strand:- start:1435 stop:1617 length:183 start_codon:yes stop_codon:yes gene_type:complete